MNNKTTPKRTLIILIIASLLLVVSLLVFLISRRQTNWLSTTNIHKQEVDRDNPNTFNFSGSTEVNPNDISQKEDTFINKQPIQNGFLPYSPAQPVYNKPSSGVIGLIKNNREIVYRVVDRETGHIIEVSNNKPPKTISSKDIPAIQEAIWVTPNKVALRYLSPDNITINTYLLNIDTKNNPTGNFLKKNILQITPSPDKSGKFYYQINTPNNQSAQHFTSSSQKNSSLVTTTDITEWMPQWVTPDYIYLTTKASGKVGGYLYSLNINTGETHAVLEHISGLTTLSDNTGNKILYSQSINNNIRLYILDKKNKTSTLVGAKTLPEKCTWSKDSKKLYCFVPKTLPSALYPDDWYKGLVNFNDNLIEIDATNGQITTTTDLNRGAFDGTVPVLTADETHLTAIDRNTYLPWSFNIKEGYTQKGLGGV